MTVRNRSSRNAFGLASLPPIGGGLKLLGRPTADLLTADEHDFEARCRRMLDADGGRMIDELCGEMEIVGRQMAPLVDGLDLT